MTAQAIRQVGLRDRDLLRQAVEQFGPTADRAASDRSAEEWVTAFVASQQGFAFVALGADDELIGWAWGWHDRRPDGPPMARLGALDVQPASRRRGVGSMLFDAALAHSRQRQCGDLVAEVPLDPGDAVTAFLGSLRPLISEAQQVRWSL